MVLLLLHVYICSSDSKCIATALLCVLDRLRTMRFVNAVAIADLCVLQ